jgi:hypothetical protein
MSDASPLLSLSKGVSQGGGLFFRQLAPWEMTGILIVTLFDVMEILRPREKCALTYPFR